HLRLGSASRARRRQPGCGGCGRGTGRTSTGLALGRGCPGRGRAVHGDEPSTPTAHTPATSRPHTGLPSVHGTPGGTRPGRRPRGGPCGRPGATGCGSAAGCGDGEASASSRPPRDGTVERDLLAAGSEQRLERRDLSPPRLHRLQARLAHPVSDVALLAVLGALSVHPRLT